MTPQAQTSERERHVRTLRQFDTIECSKPNDVTVARDLLVKSLRIHDADAEKIRALEADAARYRWLRAQPNVDIGSCWFLPNEVPVPSTADELDAAIDAALSAVRPSQGDGGGKGEGEKVG